MAKIRGFLFYLWTFTLALPLFVTMLAQAPFVLLFDKHRWVNASSPAFALSAMDEQVMQRLALVICRQP